MEHLPSPSAWRPFLDHALAVLPPTHPLVPALRHWRRCGYLTIPALRHIMGVLLRYPYAPAGWWFYAHAYDSRLWDLLTHVVTMSQMDTTPWTGRRPRCRYSKPAPFAVTPLRADIPWNDHEQDTPTHTHHPHVPDL